MPATNPETPAHAPWIARACLLVMLAGVLAVVAIVPLLVDPTSIGYVYYAPKARALWVLGPLLALAWLGHAVLLPCSIDRPVLVPALLFALAAAAATWGSVDSRWSLWGADWRNEGLLTLLAYVAVFLASSALSSLWLVRWWRTALLSGASAVALYGVAQYAGYEWLIRDWQRQGWWQAFSTTGNPNWLGAYMALVAPLALAAVVAARRRGDLALAAAALLLLYLTALFTWGRAAWLALAFALAITTALVLRRWRVLPVRRYLAALLCLVAVTALFLAPWSPLRPRGPGSPAPGAAAPLARVQSAVERRDTSTELRFYLWRKGTALLARRPLLGYGPEALVAVFPQRDPEKLRLLGTIPVDKAHNETLDMALSLGLLGAGAFWWLVLVCLRRAWIATRAADTRGMLGIACFAGIVAYLFDLQFHFSVVSVAPVFWSVLGAAAALGAARDGRDD